jgi:hypothetical protein
MTNNDDGARAAAGRLADQDALLGVFVVDAMVDAGMRAIQAAERRRVRAYLLDKYGRAPDTAEISLPELVEKVGEALAFYAAEDNWSAARGKIAPAIQDRGGIARGALELLEGSGNGAEGGE